MFSNCVYVDGNLEISNFKPFSSLHEDSTEDYKYDDKIDTEYDFSFLDDIKEITGYLLIHNTRLKNLRLKNLQLIRGKNLVYDKYSIYIQGNVRLERLEISSLRGMIFKNLEICNFKPKLWPSEV